MYIVFTQKQKAISVIGPSRCAHGLGTSPRPIGHLKYLSAGPLYLQYILYKYTYTTHLGLGDCVPHTVFLGLPTEREVRFVSQSKEDTVI
jgi:hypothetical protein